MASLSIVEVIRFLEANKNPRCMQEGEAVVKAKHLVLCGRSNSSEEVVRLYGLCLQSTALDQDPHMVQGVLDVTETNVTVRSMLCSCKAGNSGKCKHISALLMNCARADTLNDLEVFSQTDINCMWSTQTGVTAEKYKAVPVLEMPCFAGKVNSKNVVFDKEMFEFFTTSLPDSALNKHRLGRKKLTPSKINEDKSEINEDVA